MSFSVTGYHLNIHEKINQKSHTSSVQRWRHVQKQYATVYPEHRRNPAPRYLYEYHLQTRYSETDAEVKDSINFWGAADKKRQSKSHRSILTPVQYHAA